MRVDVYFRDLAQRCRYWSRYTVDLTAAREFRRLAQELETKAKEVARCSVSDVPDKRP
jgi:hypothetical protein